MKLEPTQLLKTGQPLKLSCKVQGTPVISIVWFKNGSETISDHRHTMSFDNSLATLEVENCSVEDSGDYVCVASSEAGRDQCSSSVTVKGWSSLYKVFPVFLKQSLDCWHKAWSILFYNMFSAAYRGYISVYHHKPGVVFLSTIL